MSLVARYKLNDLNDSSGNYEPLTTVGVVPLDTDAPYGIGKYLDQTVLSSYYMSQVGQYLNSETFSICGWVKHDDLAYPRTIFNLKQANQAYTTGIGWEIGAGHYALGVFLTVNDGTTKLSYSYKFDVGSQPDDLLGEWHHITYVINSDAKTIKVYIDGKVQADTFDFSAVTGSIVDPNERFWIGYTYGWKVAGGIQDVQIYDHALTAKEVEQIYLTPVLHLDFNNDVEPTENLFTNKNYLGHGNTITYDTFSLDGYRSTYTSVVSDPESVGGNFGFRFEDQYGLLLETDTTYFLSSKVFIVSHVNQPTGNAIVGYFRIYYDDATNDIFFFSPPNSVQSSNWGKWLDLEVEVTVPVGKIPTGQTALYLYSDRALSGEMTMAKPQLEKKDHPTSFVDGIRIGDGIVRDKSGWDNHAILGTYPPTFSSDSAIGSGSYDMGGHGALPSFGKSLSAPARPQSGSVTYIFWFWIPPSTDLAVGHKMIIGEGATAHYVSLYNTDGIYFSTVHTPSGQSATLWSGLSSILNYNGWNFLAVSYDAIEQHKRYNLNGTEHDVSVNGAGPITSIPTRVDVGKWYLDGYDWHGKVGACRTYPFALTADEVKSIYETRASADKNGTVRIQGEVVETGIPNSLLTVDGDRLDSAAINYGVTFDTGVPVFDGASYIKWLNNDKFEAFTNPTHTYVFRFKADIIGGARVILSMRSPCSNNGNFLIWLQSSYIYYGWYTSAGGVGAVGTFVTSVAAGIVAGTTYDVVISKVYGTDILKTWVNGVEQVLSPPPTFLYSIPGNSSNIVTVGAQDGLTATCSGLDVSKDNFFTGTIDKVKILNFVPEVDQLGVLFEDNLTARVESSGNINTSEIDEIGPTDGLIGYWPLDGDTKDYSGNGNDLINTNGEVVDGQKGNKAYHMPTVSTMLTDISKPIALENDAFTISLWWEAQDANTNSQYVMSIWDGSQMHRIFTYLNYAYYRVFDSNGLETLALKYTTLTGWNHICGVFDGTSIKLYTNNTLVYAIAVTSGSVFTPMSARIGISDNIDYWTFNINQARMYDRALSDKEVGQLYNLHNPNKALSINNNGTINALNFIEGI